MAVSSLIAVSMTFLSWVASPRPSLITNFFQAGHLHHRGIVEFLGEGGDDFLVVLLFKSVLLII